MHQSRIDKIIDFTVSLYYGNNYITNEKENNDLLFNYHDFVIYAILLNIVHKFNFSLPIFSDISNFVM